MSVSHGSNPIKVLLVYPQSPDTFWSFKHVLRFVSKRATFPPLGLLTIAAMLPADWQLKLVDLNVERLKDSDLRWADYVMLSAMIIHKQSVQEIVARCAASSKPVIAGGPLFTTGHEAFPAIQHFVLGEAEDVMPQLVADMRAGTLQPQYRAADRPDIIARAGAALGPDQFQALRHHGRPVLARLPLRLRVLRHHRHERARPPHQDPRPTDRRTRGLRLRGWKDMVFIVDDNFIGDKKRTKTLLRELIAWRERVRPDMGFFTEASVNLADDAELCELMVKAGFKKVFVGIETPSAESLQECHKLQNKGRDLVETVKTLQRAGLEVMGGFIVGFDSDRQDIFKQQFDFIQRSGVVTAMVGLLSALPQTRLYHRLKKEGRLEADSTGNNTEAVLNFKPKLNREFLQSGYRDLMKKLYEPKVYYQRIRTFLKHYRPSGPRLRLSPA